jgi:hypothetical protein
MSPLPRRRPAAGIAFTAAVIAVATVGLLALIVLLPWPLSFATAAGSATTWCIWLEEHPQG